MLVRNTTMGELRKALNLLNKKYKRNIIFIEMENANKKKTAFRFRLWCKDSHKPGGRLTQSGRHIPAVCWHAHGDFWDILFAINPQTKVWVHKWVTKDKGNWEDRNIGSMINPLMYSDACECNNNLKDMGEIIKTDLQKSPIRIIPQKDMTGECFLIQMSGISACESCEAKDTEDCGGKEIRKKLVNEKGISVPLGKAI